MRGAEKELNGLLEEAILGIATGIKRFVCSVYRGIKKLKEVRNLVFFLICIVFSALVYLLKGRILLLQLPAFLGYALYYVLLFVPVCE